MRFGAAWRGANFELIDKTTEIAPGIHLIALASDKPGTLELRELSLALSTLDGMVIVVGCSHGHRQDRGTAELRSTHASILSSGGSTWWYPRTTKSKRLSRPCDTFKVVYVAPGHCTGEPTFTALKKTFGDRYLYAGLGTTFSVGATPRRWSALIRMPSRSGWRRSPELSGPPGRGAMTMALPSCRPRPTCWAILGPALSTMVIFVPGASPSDVLAVRTRCALAGSRDREDVSD